MSSCLKFEDLFAIPTIRSTISQFIPLSCLFSAYIRLRLHGSTYLADSSVSILRYRANLKAIRYKLTSLNIIVADKSHRVIVA